MAVADPRNFVVYDFFRAKAAFTRYSTILLIESQVADNFSERQLFFHLSQLSALVKTLGMVPILLIRYLERTPLHG